MVTKLRLVLSTTIVFFSFYGVAQTSYWKRDVVSNDIISSSLRRIDVQKATLFSLSSDDFKKALPSRGLRRSAGSILYFPNEKGELLPYQVTPSPVLSPQLAARYPEIRSFTGQSLTNPEERIRFSLSHKGIQAMMVHAGGRTNSFLQKVEGMADQYLVYQREDLPDSMSDFVCDTFSGLEKQAPGSTYKLVDDQLLRKYRIAVSATGEYTQFHGGTVADALAAINATLTRVNEVFETDLGVTLELIAATDQVIFTDPATDPYESNLNMEVQNTLSATIGEAGYDVGHLFHRDNDFGNAGFIGSVCQDNQKGSAFTSGQNPQGDQFDLDYVAHEIGHQFGARHTWSFVAEDDNQVQIEPGSGSTIMGYAGIVDGNNVQANGDDYFHYFSILQITDYLQTISCGETISIANNPPEITPLQDFTIPIGTAFVLTGTATDPDTGDVLTYAWEQIDHGVVTASTFGPTNAAGANFRSRRPTESPSRYFPNLEEVRQGNLTQTSPAINTAWETVSEVERELHFALTVRDNAMGGGQVASDLLAVKVLSSAGPFVVNSQGGGETYPAGTVQTVSWEVAGTDRGLVNAQKVDIFLSTDGGRSYPLTLAEAVPNDGSHEVLLPGVVTPTARIMVKASNNIFFAINAGDFSITESPVVLQFEKLDYTICQPDSLQIPFSYEAFGGFSEEVTFSASGFPPALGIAFAPDTVTTSTNPVNLSITNTDLVTPGIYPLIVTANSTSQNVQVALQLQILDGNFGVVTPTAPLDGALDVSLNVLLAWSGDASYTNYELEIATDAGFTDTVETANVIFARYTPTQLQEDTTYYWRVKPLNPCGEGSFSTPFSFTTIPINCQSRTAADTPLPITSIGTPTVESTISFLDDLPVSDVKVTLDLEHTFLGDLVISLISPAGTEVVLVSNSCGEFNNISAVFDEAGAPIVCGEDPAINGVVKPLGSLASLKGESTFGDWVLRISDTAPADGGTLNGFSLEICAEGEFRPDADGDGVFDDGDDLCLGTPKGAEVDPSGCQVFRFDPRNFSVQLETESCIPSNNGAITIGASEILDYTVQVTGPGIDVSDSFTASYQLGGLSSGTYDLCIGGSDGTNVYEPYCFEVVIREPEPLSVVATVSPDGQQAELLLSGAGLYLVELNGMLQQVTDPEITLDLKAGENTLKVSTLLPCQGSYDERIYVAGVPVFFPNPFDEELRIHVGNLQEAVEIHVFGIDGQLLERRGYTASGGEILLDFSGRPSGLYLIRLDGPQLKGTYKVMKR